MFDAFLDSEGLAFEATIIGGSALVLLDVVQRTTDDCDVLDPPIPTDIDGAAKRFARAHGLAPDWLNAKSHDFVRVPGCLPPGWRSRLRPAFEGSAFRLSTLGRADLLATKLVALVDRGTDYEDCVALSPTTAELKAAWPFVVQYEANPESREVFWIPTARKQFNRLVEALGIDGIF